MPKVELSSYGEVIAALFSFRVLTLNTVDIATSNLNKLTNLLKLRLSAISFNQPSVISVEGFSFSLTLTARIG